MADPWRALEEGEEEDYQGRKPPEEAEQNEEETKVLKEIINHLKEELNIDPTTIALAALNLSIGSTNLLEEGNEDWIKQSTSKNHRNDRRDSKFKSRRRTDQDNGRPDEDMERFRVEVGHRDRVKPGNLVGAIANETGLHGRMIGRIRIFETYSLVDLPKKMPEKIFTSLKRIKVMNRELQINRSE